MTTEYCFSAEVPSQSIIVETRKWWEFWKERVSIRGKNIRERRSIILNESEAELLMVDDLNPVKTLFLKGFAQDRDISNITNIQLELIQVTPSEYIKTEVTHVSN